MKTGDVLTRTAHIERVNLVMYAGASGDFNPIHWSESFAKAVGLPDVIAHGMYTQAQLGRLLVEWAGDPGRVLSFSVRFSAPVVVPDAGGADLQLRAEVTGVEDGVASIQLTAVCEDQDVVKDAVATIRVA
ncbi:MAG: MaoC/PaaZ C-terminal domain-containing protein [Candidatus Nanopelagicales bacterium]